MYVITWFKLNLNITSILFLKETKISKISSLIKKLIKYSLLSIMILRAATTIFPSYKLVKKAEKIKLKKWWQTWI